MKKAGMVVQKRIAIFVVFALVMSVGVVLTAGYAEEEPPIAHTTGEGVVAVPEEMRILACDVRHEHDDSCHDVWILACDQEHDHSLEAGCFVFETAAIPYSFNYDLSAFVPGSSYGLHILAGSQPASLDNWMFTPSEEYVLEAEFKVDEPVDPGEKYRYPLPKELIGQSSESRPISSGADFGTCAIDDARNELVVVFTEAAADHIYENGSLTVRYVFRQRLDMGEIGETDRVRFYLRRKSGDEQVTVRIARETAPAVVRSVTVVREMPDIIRDGDTFILKATMVGFDGANVKINWQCETDAEWIDVEGGDTTLVVTANQETVNSSWRVLVTASAPEL